MEARRNPKTTTCSYDSGSATGCQPLCHQPATTVIVQHACGGYGPFSNPVCKRHRSPMLGRIAPSTYDVRPVAS